ncbi:MAG: hypothetical protein AAFR73_01760 [Pseudomonadota bacterium]
MSAIRHIMTVLALSVLLASCQEADTNVSEDDLTFPDILAPQKAACERSNGVWAKLPDRETFTCFKQTRDANQSCDSAGDCEGVCLARSRTCAPQIPLFGCHDVLSENGFRQTLCIE